jgi:phosphopantetheinyl transferase
MDGEGAAPGGGINLLGPATISAAAGALRRGQPCVVLIPAGSALPPLPPPLATEHRAAQGLPNGDGFLLRRQLARAIAGAASSQPPEALSITAGPLGAPRLTGMPGIHISFSARGGHGLVGLAGVPIGVDLEGRIDAEALPWHVLRPEEARALRTLQGRAREEAFLRLWTRKEAVLKALGTGFSVPPEHLDLGKAGRFMIEAAEKMPSRSGPLVLTQATWQDGQNRPYGLGVALLPPDLA